MPKPAVTHRPFARGSYAVLLAASLVTYGSTLPTMLAAQAAQAGDLRIAVVQGEDSVNIIQQRTAVPTIVEVRDRNNLPVAGASVLFLLGGSAGTASLNNGATQVTLTTNAAGRATVTVNPLSRGTVQLQVRATYQGQTATTTVNQTNFQTAAQAAQAGKSPTTSGESAATGGASTAATAAGAGAGAAAAGATAAGGSTGGGLSTLAIAGIAGGAAGGFVAYKKITANKPPTISGSVTATPTTALLGLNNTVGFAVDAKDEDNGPNPLSYTWDFGDGGSASSANPAHVYTAAGAFTVKVTVSDGKDSVSQTTTVTIKALAGNWRTDPVTSVAGTLNMIFALTQSGASKTFAGTFTQGSGTGPITDGSLQTGQPQVTFTVTPTLSGQTFQPFTFTGNFTADYNTINGALNGSGFVNQSIALLRQ